MRFRGDARLGLPARDREVRNPWRRTGGPAGAYLSDEAGRRGWRRGRRSTPPDSATTRFRTGRVPGTDAGSHTSSPGRATATLGLGVSAHEFWAEPEARRTYPVSSAIREPARRPGSGRSPSIEAVRSVETAARKGIVLGSALARGVSAAEALRRRIAAAGEEPLSPRRLNQDWLGAGTPPPRRTAASVSGSAASWSMNEVLAGSCRAVSDQPSALSQALKRNGPAKPGRADSR